MFNVNRVTLLGNVTRDPDAMATKAGRPLSILGLATNRSWKDASGERKSEPEFHKLVCWGPLASFTADRVKKGSPVYVEGRLHTGHWENKEGEEQSRTEIIVDRLVLLSGKKTGDIDAAEAPEDEAPDEEK
ncbi:MAG: single-stranded DNA-binding protein [Candidatus Peribacteraceae bacterium]|nr:single-stranded DNA-binding protein [Candidatus Peribacteraceae bacterium]MDD5074884.1 single-stranded DNA-binding protein [Candidatus Peribacteraceae bacterium]